MKKTIKCKFVGWHEDIKKILNEKYTVIETENPDFAFFDCQRQDSCVD